MTEREGMSPEEKLRRHEELRYRAAQADADGLAKLMDSLKSGGADTETTMAELSRAIPEVVVFWHDKFEGADWRTHTGWLYVGDHWNDQISSIIVVSGKWQFYEEADFRYPMGNPLGPGYYRNVTDHGIKNDAISSFEIVGW